MNAEEVNRERANWIASKQAELDEARKEVEMTRPLRRDGEAPF